MGQTPYAGRLCTIVKVELVIYMGGRVGGQLLPQFFENFSNFPRKLPQNHQKLGLFRCFAPPVFALPPQFLRHCAPSV